MRWAMAVVLYLLLSFSGLPLVAQDVGRLGTDPAAAPSGKVSNKISSEQLLISAYLLAMDCVPEERLNHLTRLAVMSSNHHPDLTRLWSEELFKLSFTLEPSWNRVAIQKNALLALSAVDPVRAMELFEMIDKPYPQRTGGLPEDVRADAANTIFQRYWKLRLEGRIDTIQSVARRIGETGQYPYVAIAPIISELAKAKDSRSVELFNEAISYYLRGSKIRVADQDFFSMLTMLKDQVPAPSLRSALEAFQTTVVSKIKNDADSKEFLQIHTDRGAVTFNNSSELLLFQAIPLLREKATDLLEELLDKQSSLRTKQSAAGAATLVEGVFAEPSVPSSEISPAMREGFEEYRLLHIEETFAREPEQALALAQDLTIPEFRAAALSYVAAGYAATDGKKSVSLSKEADILLCRMPSVVRGN